MARTLAAYLEKLPRGAASYPESQVKGSVLAALLARIPRDVRLRTGHPDLDALILNPPSIVAWFSEVAFNAICLAAYEALFAGRGDLAAYDEWTYRGNLSLFRGPIYRVLFFVTSTDRLVIGAQNRWKAFRRGSTIRCTSHGQGKATLVIDNRPHLVSEVAACGFAAAFRASMVATGAQDPKVVYRLASPSETVFDLSWRD